MAGERILIVDDSVAVCKTMASILQEAGYVIHLAHSGEEALEVLKKEAAFDLVTLDVHMDGLDGYETCQKIRESDDPLISEVSIIFVTSTDTVEGRNKGFLAGASEFLSKSSLRGMIVQTVDRLIRPERLMEMKALVVVGDKVERGLLVRNLKEIFRTVEGVEDGTTALMKIKTDSSIELVVSGFDLPQLSGIKLLEATRKNLGLRELPFILLIALEERQQTLEFFKNGGTDCVVRPFMKEELHARVRTHIERVFLMREQQANILKLRKLSEEKNAIIAACSHDLKTPLNSILGFTELLKEEIAEPQILNDLSSIESAGHLLQGLVQNILDMYREQSIKSEMKLSLVDLDKEARECIDINSSLALRKGIDLRYKTEGDLPKINGDPLALKRVVNNLISNALKFTKKGGSVTVLLKSKDDGIQVSVSDTGIGMSEEIKKELFKKFSKGSRAGTSGEPGTGLGLMIAKQIVEFHLGEIEVESKVNEGSTFSFFLPQACSLENTAPSSEGIVPLETAKEKTGEKVKLKVLIVDDDPNIIEYLYDILEDAGFDVHSAESANEAASALAMIAFDVLVTDLVMPGMNGLELARAARRKYEDLKVVVCTGALNPETYFDESQDSSFVLMSKPFEETSLIEAIEKSKKAA